MGRPNILWISLEDTSPRFGCYGDDVARTPSIDRLVADGCIFPRAFSVAGVCAPSRSAIITGMYPTSSGTHHMRTTHTVDPLRPLPYSACPPPHVKCFTEYLRGAGYYCTNNAKTDYQFTVPLTAWDELGTEAHWRNRPADMPFFAVFNPTVTHESGMWEERHGGSPTRTSIDTVELPPYLPDTEPCRRALARHYDNLEKADHQRVRRIRCQEPGATATERQPLPERHAAWPRQDDFIYRARGTHVLLYDPKDPYHRPVPSLELALHNPRRGMPSPPILRDGYAYVVIDKELAIFELPTLK